jgi:phytoene dehydrogenase-like protein
VNAQGRATGVELVDGTTIAARQVVSNAHPITTYLALVGREHLPSEVVRDIERYRTRSGSVKVNVALGELPTFPCWDQEGPLHRGLVAISPSIEYLERAFDDAKYGQPSRHPYVEVVFPTAHEDGLAPEGKHLMLGFSQYLPYDTPNTDATREAWARSVLEALEAYAPGLSGLVEHAEVLTPRDLEERYGLVGGNIMHGELVPDQLFSFRPIPFYGDHRTPIRGLYLCGAGTHPGGGVMAVPGRNAARVILRDARLGRVAERVDGALDQVRGLLARD